MRSRLPLSNTRSPCGQPAGPSSAHRLAALARVSLLALSLAGCGGENADDGAAGGTPPPAPPPATGTVSISASLGVVLNADVSVTCAPTGAALGTGSTGSTGVVSVATSGSCSGPVLVTVSGRADGTSTYFDEALNSPALFPAGSSLRAVAPALASPMNLAVTPLTEIAAAQALAGAGSLAALSAAQVNAANTAVVAQVLGAGVTLDILTPPTMWSITTAPGSLGTGDADRYAFYLAGLARMALGHAAPARAITEALAADLADGSLAGGSSGSFSYTPASLPGQLNAGLTSMASFASSALQGALGIVAASPVAVSSFTPVSGAVGATVTLTGTGFDADPFHMQVRFANNLTAEVVSSSATSVVVKVPAGAVNGPIVVTNTLTGQSVTTSASFTVSAGGGGTPGAWVSRASPSGFLLNGLAYGGGRFVAVGFGQTLLTSSDGLSWTAGTAPDSNYYDTKSVIWTGSQFVMVGDKNFGSSAPPLIATSPDGLAWTRRAWTPDACCSLSALTDVAAGGGRVTVAGGSSLASSADGGLTWTVDSKPAGVFPTIAGMAGNDSTRVAVGSQSGAPTIIVDTGTGWRLAGGTLDPAHSPADVTWTGTQFVAVGGRGVMRSADGVTWTTATLADTELPTGIFLTTVRAVGATLYATGDNFSNKHAIIKSDDGGVTWSVAYEGTTNGIANLAGIAASAERIVTVGGVKSVTLP
ncbi:MAG: exo-alpha-sialidase [Burkholderiales bacterium]|nr:exo-alpha-sialidase [Burkholderiales bacterium]